MSVSTTSPVRDFLLQLEKTLTIRRLYAPHMTPYQDACRALEENLWRALDPDGFTLRVGATELRLGDELLLVRPERETSFFFPLFRDGLRELTFSPAVSAAEIEQFLAACEAERTRQLAPDEDLVAYLWRCDLHGVRFGAVDGIGDDELSREDLAAATDHDYGAVVAELVAKLHEIAPAETGQSYAFVVDADVPLAASDLHYDPTTSRRPFTDNPIVFRLDRQEASELRREVAREDEADLLHRFTDILFALLDVPEPLRDTGALVAVVQQLIAGLWQAAELGSLREVLRRLRLAVDSAPTPEIRAQLQQTLESFFDHERLSALFAQVQSQDGAALDEGRVLWELAGDEVWPRLLELWQEMPAGTLRDSVRGHLRARLALHPELLRQELAGNDAQRILAGLALLDPRVEPLFAGDLLRLCDHPEEEVRLRALTAAGRLGSEEARQTLWRVLDADLSGTVRLRVLRQLAHQDRAALAEHLRWAVQEEHFRTRPLWERRRSVQMLAEVLGEPARDLFAGWLPRRRWIWSRDEEASAELAIHGLLHSGGSGVALLQELAGGRGRLGRAAREALRGAPATARRGAS